MINHHIELMMVVFYFEPNSKNNWLIYIWQIKPPVQGLTLILGEVRGIM